jgi:hypothetical protein
MDLKQDCFMCPEIFRTVPELNHHMQQVHNHYVKPLKVLNICNLCQLKFPSDKKLIKHLRSKICVKQKLLENGTKNDVLDCDVTVKVEKEEFV